MSMPVRVSALSMIILAGLVGCGGGGGGGGGVIAPGQTAGAPVEVNFSSFGAIAPNQTVVMSGLSQGGSGTDIAFNVDSNASNGTVKLTFDEAGNVSGVSMSTPSASLSYGGNQTKAVIDEDSNRRTSFVGFNDKSFVMATDPAFYGWNYQSFGVWMNNLSGSAFQAGGLSVGAATPGSAVPTIGSATFTGHAGGFYLDGAGVRFGTDAQMRAVTNFENRTIQFSTDGTLLTDMRTLSQTTNTGLDLRGNLSYAQGASQFSGNVGTANGNLSGNATGRFYGPGAQEIGGVYGLSGANGTRMFGGFGGKQ